jgi:hypothetical protein
MLFSNSKNTKEQGNIGLSAAIHWFVSNGYTVNLPLNDSQDYDLIVDINDILSRVQIKTTRYKVRDSYRVCLKSSGGSKGKVYKQVVNTKIEYLFVLTEIGEMYLIPFSNVTQKYELALSEYLIFKIY